MKGKYTLENYLEGLKEKIKTADIKTKEPQVTEFIYQSCKLLAA